MVLLAFCSASKVTGVGWARTLYRLYMVRSTVQLRAYSLSRESAEKIKNQLSYNRARLHTPEDLPEQNQNFTEGYKGLVVLAAGPVIGQNSLKQLPTLYLQSGFAVMTIIHRQIDYGFCTAADRTVDKMFNILSATLDDSCPIVLKLCCSGSYSYLPRIIHRISQPDCNLNVVGAIFDSGPPLVHWRIILRISQYFHEIGKYRNPLHRLEELILPLLSSTINVRNKRKHLEDLMYSPNTKLITIPQLYVYSLTDFTLDFPYINGMIDKQREYGGDATCYTFPDTLHLFHRLKYPEEYDGLIFEFLRSKCKLPV